MNFKLVVLIVIIFLTKSYQYTWYRFADQCFMTGEMNRLEKSKVDHCTNYTKTLIFKDGRIRFIENDAFSGLDTKSLYIINNHLREIGQWINALTALELLSLSNNEISKLNSTIFEGLTKLTVLNLDYNYLYSIDPDAFSGLKELDVIDLSHNELRTIKHEFEHLTNLYAIDLSHNKIDTIASGAFTKNLKLVEIYLSYNKLTQLPDNFYLKSTLRRMFLANNRIKSTKFFKESTAIDNIDLSNNNLTNLTLNNLNKLNYLYVHDNRLKYLDILDAIDNHINLKYLSINNNEISCFGLIEVWARVQKRNITLMNKYNYKGGMQLNEFGCDDGEEDASIQLPALSEVL